MRQSCMMLGIASLLSIGVFGFEKRCYRNNSDPDGVFTMVLRQTNASAEQIMALDTTKAPTNCTSVSVDPGVNELIIKFNITAQSQSSPAENCYVEFVSPDIKVYVAVQQDKDFIQASDQFYSATCNTSDVDTGFLELDPMNITNNASFVPAPNRNTSVIMELVEESGAVTTTPILGQNVKIRTTYYFDPTALSSEFPRGLHNFDLTVGPDDSSNWRIQLINNAGCLSMSANIFGVSQTYTYNAAQSASGKNVFETGTFKVVMFATTKQLHFTGRYLAECYESEDKCFDQPAYCLNLNGRKRRAIDIEVNGTYSLSVNIGLPGQSTTQQNVGPAYDTKSQECEADKTYWIIAVVLGIVLPIISMGSIYIFYRLRSEQPRVERINEKTGYTNKAL
ncbi:uncharacterized protein LOC127862259 isoform X3 [Dreissena polymorpha]|uniref:uncharacterized protein LOC127862259 isoform X3 n=1 Tax=Dreissena polymorpha TaxID=45954 RepID=UPI002264CC0E|nr:uncharacterized protein LOC127862259 isoform X3 [Dreissena polymorpha]